LTHLVDGQSCALLSGLCTCVSFQKECSPLEERSAKRIARAETEGYVKDQRREEDSERDQDKHKEKTIREHEWGPNQYAQYGQIRHHTSSCQVVSVIVGIDTVAEFDRVRGNGHSADK
jgi:hypothetical protein